MKITRVRRIITWENCNDDGMVSIDEYLSEMREYGTQKSKTVRSARHYLRSLGLQLDRNGNIININKD